MKNFALIGAAGYVAPRHMQAIQETGNRLVAALDRSDSVGVIDSYFPETSFFTEFERFDRHVDKLRRKNDGRQIDYISICSPNYLHDAHIRFALRSRAHAICEKPLVINPWNIDALAKIEAEGEYRIYNVLQLRHHPSILALKERVAKEPDRIFDIDLSYITSRGKWYMISWKGDEQKGGGIAMNIGIHFFDMLQWIFGAKKSSIVHVYDQQKCAGYLELERARVRWLLSIDEEDLPPEAKLAGQRMYRSIVLDGEEIEFTKGFGSLHTICYEELLAGRGYGLDSAQPSINMVYEIRHARPVGLHGEYHPLLKKKP